MTTAAGFKCCLLAHISTKHWKSTVYRVPALKTEIKGFSRFMFDVDQVHILLHQDANSSPGTVHNHVKLVFSLPGLELTFYKKHG